MDGNASSPLKKVVIRNVTVAKYGGDCKFEGGAQPCFVRALGHATTAPPAPPLHPSRQQTAVATPGKAGVGGPAVLKCVPVPVQYQSPGVHQAPPPAEGQPHAPPPPQGQGHAVRVLSHTVMAPPVEVARQPPLQQRQHVQEGGGSGGVAAKPAVTPPRGQEAGSDGSSSSSASGSDSDGGARRGRRAAGGARRRRRPRKSKSIWDVLQGWKMYLENVPVGNSDPMYAAHHHRAGGKVEQPRPDTHLNSVSIEYTAADVYEATRGLSSGCVVGSGAFGSVYRGTMRDGTEAAIKMLSIPDVSGFEDEVKVLSRFRHPNIVILIGFARHPESGHRSLIYEYLAGGDASKRIARSRKGTQEFGAEMRLSVALDAANGLSHLHNAKPRAFHRDIKCPNILLDKNGTAKIADFGLACISSSSRHKVQQASGTAGYACPEYLRTGVVTEGSEVYSFGMVLLELLTSVPPAIILNRDRPEDLEYLVARLQNSIQKVIELLDATAKFPEDLARKISDIAFQCITSDPAKRPLFVQLVEQLRHLLNSTYPSPIPVHSSAAMFAVDPAKVVTPKSEVVAKDRPGDGADGKTRGIELPKDAGATETSDVSCCRLSCIHAEGVDLSQHSEQQRSISLPAGENELVVGRIVQPASFWTSVVPQESLRNLISRSHFKLVRRYDRGDGSGGQHSTAYFVTCLSQNGLLVNKKYLDAAAGEWQLQDGHLVSLLDTSEMGGNRKPFVTFSFHPAPL